MLPQLEFLAVQTSSLVEQYAARAISIALAKSSRNAKRQLVVEALDILVDTLLLLEEAVRQLVRQYDRLLRLIRRSLRQLARRPRSHSCRLSLLAPTSL